MEVAEKSKSKFGVLFLIYLALSLAVIASYQPYLFGMDPDDLNYLAFYLNIKDDAAEALEYSRFEPGYSAYVYIFSSVLDLGYENFVLLSALLSISLKFYCFASLRRPALVAGVYTLSLFALYELVQVRYALALSFVLLGIKLDLDGRRHVSAFFYVLAVTFHYATLALIVFVIFPSALTERIGRRELFLFLAAAFAVLPLLRAEKFSDFVSGYAPLYRVYFMNYDSFLLNPINAQTVAFSVLVIIGLLRWEALSAMRRSLYLYSLCCLATYFVFLQSPVIASRFIEASTIGHIYWATQEPRIRRATLELTVILVFSIFYAGKLMLFSDMFF